MNTSILKLEATVIRPKDDDELDGLAASISFPVESTAIFFHDFLRVSQLTFASK